jgi:diguanylate cyclase (GGDEF)-like protein
LGGDKFAVLLPLTSLAPAKLVFNNIQDQLREAAQQRGWPVGFSTGIAVFTKSHLTASESFKKADELIYQVKKSGKNNFLYQEY